MTNILTHLTLSSPQQTAVETRERDVVVTAGAGTGKTRTLVARYLSLLADDIPLRKIVAITFTRKAAREMRNRVRGDISRFLTQPGLEPKEYQRWQTYQNGLDAARIGTIHSLCSEILRSHPAEAGVDPRFNVLDEVQSALLVQETVEAAMVWAVKAASSPGRAGDEVTRLFGFLSEGQVQELIGVMLSERPSMTALVDNLPHDSVYSHWQEQLAKAQAVELERLTADPEWRECVNELRRNEPSNQEDKQAVQRLLALSAVSEAEGKTPVVRRRALSILNEINLSGGSGKAWPGGTEQLKLVREALKGLREMWRGAKILALELNGRDVAAADVMPAVYALFEYAARHYSGAKEEREALDFDDLEGAAVALLEREAAVREYWQGEIQALLVDEFQDTNEQQRQFIRLLCPEPGKLFIVGDAKQSIYRFRGADVTVFQTERHAIEMSGGNAVKLETSYRAHEALLACMNRLLRPVLGDDSPERPAYVAPFDPLAATDKGIAPGLEAPFVEFHVALGNKAEALPAAANGLAKRLVELRRKSGLDYGEMAILCRASNAFQYYENALDAAGIPYLTVAGKGFFDRPEIRDLLNALQATADPHDDLALAGLLRSPGCGLSDESLYYLAKGRSANHSLWETIEAGFQLPDGEEQKRLAWSAGLLRRLHQLAGRTRAADLLKVFLDETNYLAALRLARQHRALRNVNKLLADVHASELVDVNDFLVFIQSLKTGGSREGEARSTVGGAVQIMSIHQAKGLEFPVMVLGDAAGGGSRRRQNVIINSAMGVLLGHKDDNDEKSAAFQLGELLNREQEAAENDRLLYVALTRAEQVLMISGYGWINKSGLSLGGWLGQLAEITGLADCSLDGYDEAGEGSMCLELDGAGTAVTATFYEPQFQPVYSQAARERVKISGETLEQVHRKLELPVFEPETVSDEEEERPQRVWQVVSGATRPETPAWMVGTLVHEAISLWRFPDGDLEKWIRARAGGYGLTDESQLTHAVAEVQRLLERFRQWELFPEINGAERRFHELPYSYEVRGVVEMGFIDLLYRYGSRWAIVDFKTDDIWDEQTFFGLPIYRKYVSQIMKYGTAVTRLLGERPRLFLCFLNGRNGVITKPIPAAPDVRTSND